MAVQTVVLEQRPLWRQTKPVNPVVAPKQRVYDTLPYEDDEVLETNWHRQAMSQLIEIIGTSWEGSKHSFVGGNMFVYFAPNQVKTHNFRGPDFFVVKDVDPDPSRKSWVIWDENFRAPNVVIELSSSSTREMDYGEKKDQYEQILKVNDYFVYDPEQTKLTGWRLQRGVYVELQPNSKGWLWCEELGLWLGVQKGVFDEYNTYWLRFYNKHGRLLLNKQEAEERERQAKEQANRRAKQAQFQTEQERQAKEQANRRAKQAQLQTEQERQAKEQANRRAKQAQLQTEQERQAKEQANRRAEKLTVKLRELGIDPDSIER
ncbi:Uma2 family endonuclease [Anaerolineales bacterium HSG25]|nr:Uma2 family endonuclease [Anaerolineales bacterium HSG25]